MKSSQWILKILSGLHLGAEMPLDFRVYSVGQTIDSDVVINDSAMAGEEFSICVESSGITLRGLSPALVLLVDGTPILAGGETDVIAVDQNSVYSVGSFCFCIGDAEAIKDKTSSMPRTSTIANKAFGSGIREGGPGALVSVGIFVLMLSVGVLFSAPSSDAHIQREIQSTVDLPGIIDQVFDFEQLEVVRATQSDEAPLWVLEGYLETDQELLQLKQHLQGLGVSYEVDVRVMEDIRIATQRFLDQLKLNHLLVKSGRAPGELVVTGVQDDLEQWGVVKKLLITDIAGLKSIVDQVESVEGRLLLVKEWIEQEGLDQKVVVSAVDGRMVVTSELELDKSVEWERIQERFTSRFDAPLNITVLMANRPTMDIRSVSHGKVPYLVLNNGRRYSIGAHVGRGYYLAEIDQSAVILQRGEESLKYSVGDSTN